MQTLRLETPGCTQAMCELSNDRGSWQLSQAPGSVTVAVSREPLRVICRADDSATTSAQAASSRPASSGGGAVTGGVVGGAAVGVALGSAALAFIPPLGVFAVLTGAGLGAAAGDKLESSKRQVRYAESISIPMRCSAAVGGAAEWESKGPKLGLSIRGMTVSEASASGLGERAAVMVTAVAADGRAAALGLRAGDVILATDGQDLSDAADFEERVRALPPGAPLALQIWRDRRTVALELTRPPKAAP